MAQLHAVRPVRCAGKLGGVQLGVRLTARRMAQDYVRCYHKLTKQTAQRDKAEAPLSVEPLSAL